MPPSVQVLRFFAADRNTLVGLFYVSRMDQVRVHVLAAFRLDEDEAMPPLWKQESILRRFMSAQNF
jgi:hypothetical protein